MANIMNNRIQKTLTAAEQAELNDLIQKVEDFITAWAKSLTLDERIKLPKMDDANSVFTGDAIIAADTTPGILPGYISLDNTIKSDMTFWNQLRPFVQRMKKLSELLEDTMMLTGSEAYSTALVIYGLFKEAAKAGVPGADTGYNKMGERFADQGNQGTPADAGKDSTKNGDGEENTGDDTEKP